MFRVLLTILFFLVFNSNHLEAIESAVTYELINTRFGDNILCYLHAQWIAYTFNIPVLYKPFKYSDQLMLHSLGKKYVPGIEKQYKQHIVFTKNNIPTEPCSHTLYTVPYFGEPIDDHVRYKNWIYFAIDWKDPGFRELIKKSICPRQSLDLIRIPPGVISVALHVRTGIGFDGPILAEVFPFKCPPLPFYVNALQKLLALVNDKPLYIFIFTDHPHPRELATFFKKNISAAHITWGWRENRGNRFYDQDVLEDFFSMIRFDCLIRSESHFSFCAAKLADYMVEISPKTFYVSEKVNELVL